jgi:ankyrin repeat protein
VYVAAQEGHATAIRVLAELGANVNTPDNDGWTPVLIATYNGQVDAVKVLKELGADVNVP